MSSKLAAELSGTFWLVPGGCGSAVLAAAFPEVGIGLLGVALAFGLTVLIGACAGHAPKSRAERQALAAVYRRGGRRRT